MIVPAYDRSLGDKFNLYDGVSQRTEVYQTFFTFKRLPGRMMFDLRLFNFLIWDAEVLNLLEMVQSESPLLTLYQL